MGGGGEMQGKSQRAKGCYGDGSLKTRGGGWERCWPNPFSKNSLRLWPGSFPTGSVTLVPFTDWEVEELRDFKKERVGQGHRETKAQPVEEGEQRGDRVKRKQPQGCRRRRAGRSEGAYGRN